MKKNIVYFVQDAFGFFCCVDEDIFLFTVSIWNQNSCDFDIIVKDKGNYIIKTLFRK